MGNVDSVDNNKTKTRTNYTDDDNPHKEHYGFDPRTLGYTCKPKCQYCPQGDIDDINVFYGRDKKCCHDASSKKFNDYYEKNKHNDMYMDQKKLPRDYRRRNPLMSDDITEIEIIVVGADGKEKVERHMIDQSHYTKYGKSNSAGLGPESMRSINKNVQEIRKIIGQGLSNPSSNFLAMSPELNRNDIVIETDKTPQTKRVVRNDNAFIISDDNMDEIIKRQNEPLSATSPGLPTANTQKMAGGARRKPRFSTSTTDSSDSDSDTFEFSTEKRHKQSRIKSKKDKIIISDGEITSADLHRMQRQIYDQNESSSGEFGSDNFNDSDISSEEYAFTDSNERAERNNKAYSRAEKHKDLFDTESREILGLSSSDKYMKPATKKSSKYAK